MELYYATTNSGKVQTLQRECEEYSITIIQKPLELPEPRSSNLREITAAKLHDAYQKLKKPVVVLDSGFFIPALNGFPRAYVNFALETIGLEGILKLLEGKDRDCEFRDCLAYQAAQNGDPHYFEGYVPGKIAPEPRGTQQAHLWSPLGQIFIPAGYQHTLAEMDYPSYLRWWRGMGEESLTERRFVKWFIRSQMPTS